MNMCLRSLSAANNCPLTVAVEQPCNCGDDSPDHSTVPILLTFAGRTFAACYHFTADMNETKTLCLPAGVPIEKGGNYSVTYIGGDGITIVQSGVILVGGGEVALCEKVSSVSPKPTSKVLSPDGPAAPTF